MCMTFVTFSEQESYTELMPIPNDRRKLSFFPTAYVFAGIEWNRSAHLVKEYRQKRIKRVENSSLA